MGVLRSLYLALSMWILILSSNPVCGGAPYELRQMETELDLVLRQEISSHKARDFAYRLLVHMDRWLTDYTLSEYETSLFIQILSKARGLSQWGISPWDESFLNLISRVVPKSGLKDRTGKERLAETDIQTLLEGIRQLLSQIKTEELIQIKADFLKSVSENSQPGMQTLVKVSSWLSTLKPGRELTLTERKHIAEIISECRRRSGKNALEWKRSLKVFLSEVNPAWSPRSLFRGKKLRKAVISESAEEGIHRLLNTGQKLTQNLKRVDELALRGKILDFLPEDEARSKAQISRDWRALIHDYQRKKGYPSSSIPQDRFLFTDKLSRESRLSKEQIDVAIDESKTFGFGEHRTFLYSIYRVCLSQLLFSKLNTQMSSEFHPLQSWIRELQHLFPYFSGHSQISQLAKEIIDLKNVEVLDLSEKGKAILNRYEQLAENGNVYAQQTIRWMKELDSLGRIEQHFFKTEDQPPLKVKVQLSQAVRWPESFPDIELYSKWKEALKIAFLEPFRGTYAQEAALIRLYRGPYLRFAHPALFANLGGNESFFSTFQAFSVDQKYAFSVAEKRVDNAKEYARYCQWMNRSVRQGAYPEGLATPITEEYRNFDRAADLADHFLLRQASTYAIEGNTNRAISVIKARVDCLEKEQSMNRSNTKIKNRIKCLYNEMSLYDRLKASEFSSELLQGKDESTQSRILSHLRMSHSIISLDSFVEQRPYPTAATLLSDMNTETDCFLPDTRLQCLSYPSLIDREIRMLYWIGAGKEVKEAPAEDPEVQEKKSHLSFLSSIPNPDPPATSEDALETVQARKLLQNFLAVLGTSRPKEFIVDLARIGKILDATQWLRSQQLQPEVCLELAYLYSRWKDFETALHFFQQCEQARHLEFFATFPSSQILFTQYAQAYFETGDLWNTLRILKHKEGRVLTYGQNGLNFVDHELRIKALTELGEKDQLRKALLSTQKHDRTVLLPDLRRAAQIYEEDGDLTRAKQVLTQASEISKKLGDEDFNNDQKELDRLSLK